MKIVVTGGAGFIGRHLLSRLSDGNEVIAVVRDGSQVFLKEKASLVVMDLARPLDVSVLPSKIDVLVHLAQANVTFPEGANELMAVNTSATQQLLDYGRRAGAQQFIFASTGDVYGPQLGLSKETDAASPTNYYGVTKYAAELLVQSYSPYMVPTVLRLFQPYGPRQAGRLIPKLMERIRQKEPVQLHNEGRPRMTPVYVDDVTHAIQRAIDVAYGGILNIAGDRALSMRELAEEIGLALGNQPKFAATGEESTNRMGDNRLMKEVLGSWEMVSLSEGLSRTLNTEEANSWQAVV